MPCRSSGWAGIDDARSAYEKIRAGATLIQLYTGLIYGGFELIGEIKSGLAAALRADGHARIADAVGTGAAEWAARPLD